MQNDRRSEHGDGFRTLVNALLEVREILEETSMHLGLSCWTSDCGSVSLANSKTGNRLMEETG